LCSVCFNITISGNVGSETGDSSSGVVSITIDVSETVVGSDSGSGVTGFFRRLLGFLVALAVAVLPGIVNVGIVIKECEECEECEEGMFYTIILFIHLCLYPFVPRVCAYKGLKEILVCFYDASVAAFFRASF
jgi:hypothetical protein